MSMEMVSMTSRSHVLKDSTVGFAGLMGEPFHRLDRMIQSLPEQSRVAHVTAPVRTEFGLELWCCGLAIVRLGEGKDDLREPWYGVLNITRCLRAQLRVNLFHALILNSFDFLVSSSQ